MPGQQPPGLPPGYPPGYPYQPPPNPFATAKAAGYQPTPDELDKAFWAHMFAAGVNLICCGAIFPVVAPLLVLSMTKERGPFLMYHVNQSVIFQLALFVINTVILTASSILMLVCIGYITFFLVLIPWAIGIIYPIIVGIAAKNGEWAEYPIAGAKTMEMRSPPFK
jgi:uncharacterized Tic20 family protein